MVRAGTETNSDLTKFHGGEAIGATDKKRPPQISAEGCWLYLAVTVTVTVTTPPPTAYRRKRSSALDGGLDEQKFIRPARRAKVEIVVT